jgi:hypothetical protein
MVFYSCSFVHIRGLTSSLRFKKLIESRPPNRRRFDFSKRRLVNFQFSDNGASRSIPAAAAAVSTAAATTVTAARTTAATAAATTAGVPTTAAASTAVPTATTTAAPASAAFFGLGFIDGQGATAMFLTVQGSNRCFGFGIGAHFDKSKTLAAAGFPVRDDFRAGHTAVRAEKFLQRRAVHVIRHVTNV